MSVVLYSTHCPRCNVLEKKLQQKEVDYDEVNDTSIMEQKGYLSVTVLEVDGKVLAETTCESINNLTAQTGTIPLRAF